MILTAPPLTWPRVMGLFQTDGCFYASVRMVTLVNLTFANKKKEI